MPFVSAVKYENNFANSFSINVDASIGDVIVLACSGRNNGGIFNFDTPTWNDEQFENVSEVLSGQVGLEVFVLKCASSGTYSVSSNAGNWGGVVVTAMVFSGEFGATFVGSVETNEWSTGEYSEPSASIDAMSPGDIACVFLAAPLEDGVGNYYPDTLYDGPGIERIVAACEAPRVGKLYAYTDSGTGTITANFEKSDSGEPAWRVTAFRLFEEGSGSTESVDSYPLTIRSGQSVINYQTTGFENVSSVSIGSLPATEIDDSAGDGTHSVPVLKDETQYELFGTKIITFSDGEKSATISRTFLPPVGMNYVTLSGELDTSTNSLLHDYDDPAEVGGQIVFPDTMTVSEKGIPETDLDGTQICWYISPAKLARRFRFITGENSQPADTNNSFFNAATIKPKRLTAKYF